MQLKMTCPDCGKSVAFKEEYAGKKAKCPHCSAPIVLQSGGAPTAPKSPATKHQVPSPPSASSQQPPASEDEFNFNFSAPQPTPSPGAVADSRDEFSLDTPAATQTTSPRPAAESIPSPVSTSAVAAYSSSAAAKSEGTSFGTDVSLLISGGIAVVISAALFGMLYPLHVNEWKVGHLFWARGWVPFPVTLFGVWALAIVAMKHLNLLRQRKALRVDVLPTSIAEVIRPKHVPAFRQHIAQLPKSVRETMFVDRVERGLEHFESRSSVTEVAQVLESQAAIDAGNVESSFTLVKVFIWAIPILGFIGTVLGISEAVGGFASVIQGASELDVIKSALGEVTAGLALAFDTTLLALLFSILVMFPMSSQQKAEETLLGAVEEFCNETVLRRLDDGHQEGASNAAEIKAAVAEALAEQDAQFRLWKEQLANIGKTATDQIADGIAAVHGRLLKDYESQMLVVQQKAAQERDSLVTMVKEIQQLQIDRFNQAIEEMANLHQTLRDDYEQQAQAIYNSAGVSRQQFFEQMQATQQVHLEHFQQILNESRTLSTGTQQQLDHWQREQLQQLTSTQQQFTEQLQAMYRILEQQTEVERLQATLTQNLEALRSSGQFTDTLSGLNASLRQLRPVLEQLQKAAEAGPNHAKSGWSLFGRR